MVCVPCVSGSNAAAASSAPLEREQHVIATKHCIKHSPFSIFSVSFPVSHPLPLFPTDSAQAQAYSSVYIALEIQLLAQDFLP